MSDELDLDRQCGACGLEDHPELMTVWRDIEGEGWWRHPWCDDASWLALTTIVEA